MLPRSLIVLAAVCAGSATASAQQAPAKREWDLSALPPYKATQQVGGIIRMGGSNMSGLVVAWEQSFAAHHPEIRFANDIPSSDVAMAAMIMDTADIAPSGREPDLVEVLGFTESYLYDVLQIAVGTGAHTTLKGFGSSWSPVVFVSKDNPLTRLTMKQLDGIFGSQRSGGYRNNSASFDPDAARGPEGDIRTWGQLGLTGEWKNKPIQTYGYADTGMRHFFELNVFGGGGKWNPNYKEYTETGTKMVPHGSGVGSRDMLLTLSKDKYGIGWSGFGQLKNAADANLKAIALAKQDGGPYAEPTVENFRSHDYPLSRNVYMYLNRRPGMPLDPKLKEFLLFVLSRDGQEILAKNFLLLPLTKDRIEAERRKLD